MSATLEGQLPGSSFKNLLQVANANQGIDATLRVVADGEGTDSPLHLSTLKGKIQPSSDSTTVFQFCNAAGTPMFTIDTTNGKFTAESGFTWEGSGANLTGITGATGGVSNTGATNIVADSDVNGAGNITLTIGVTDLVQVLNNGSGNGGILQVKEQSSVTTPSSGWVGIHADNDSLYRVDDAGVSQRLADAIDLINLAANAMPSPYYRLDGSDDYVNQDLLAAELASTTNTKGTIVWRGKIHDFTTDYGRIWSFGDTNANTNISIEVNDTDYTLRANLKAAGTTQWSFKTDNTFSEDVEYTIVLVQNGTIPVLYVNGVLGPITFTVTTDQTAWFADVTGIDNGRIGCLNINSAGNTNFSNQSTNFFDAWNYDWSSTDVTVFYAGGSVPFKYRGASQDNIAVTTTTNGHVDNGVFDSSIGTWKAGARCTNAWNTDHLESTITSTNGYIYIHDENQSGAWSPVGQTGWVAGKRWSLRFQAKCSTSRSSNFYLDRIIGANPANISIVSETNPNITTSYQWYEFIFDIVATTSTMSIIKKQSNMVINDVISIDNFSLTQIGEVAGYDGASMGNAQWQDKSGNGLHGEVSGASLNNESPTHIEKYVKTGIANTATTLASIMPAGYRLAAIRAKGSAALTGVKVGTSSGGAEIVASTTAGTTPTILTLASTANDGYSESAADTIYAEHATAGETLDLTFIFEKVGS